MEKQLTAEQKTSHLLTQLAVEISSARSKYPGLQMLTAKYRELEQHINSLPTEPATEKEPVKDGFEKWLERKIAISIFKNEIEVYSNILDNYRMFSPVSQTKGLDITDEEIDNVIFKIHEISLEVNSFICGLPVGHPEAMLKIKSELHSLLSQSKQETETNK